MAKQRQRERIAPPPERRRGGFSRGLIRFLGILVLIPLVLTPLYLIVPPISTLMIYERLKGPVERDWVPLEEMSPTLLAAAVMSEDGRFCSHYGVDWAELNKVMEVEGGAPRGASTIPMQTVKNLFLWTSRSYIRKAFEIPLALYADFVLGKRRIMEIYLNIVELGPGIFGVEAAARHHFGGSAANLGDLQAALLVAALPNPAVRIAGNPGPRTMARASSILDRARRAGGYIDCLSR